MREGPTFSRPRKRFLKGRTLAARAHAKLLPFQRGHRGQAEGGNFHHTPSCYLFSVGICGQAESGNFHLSPSCYRFSVGIAGKQKVATFTIRHLLSFQR